MQCADDSLLIHIGGQWIEFFLAYCGVLAFEGDPVEWTKNHRWHHLQSDGGIETITLNDHLEGWVTLILVS